MILAAAQTRPVRGNIGKNIDDHLRLIEIAADERANLIAFPEMSITGYEREDAVRFRFERNDRRLNKLVDAAKKNKLVIIAGAPVGIGEQLYIGSFVIYTDGSVELYTKHYLHPGEEISFVSSFEYDPVIHMEEEQISLAICADIDHQEHPRDAAAKNSTIYIPGIFFSPKGIPEAHNLLGNYARNYSMSVLMANFGGPTWGQESGGHSAFWNKKGTLLAELGSSESGLLIARKENEEWMCSKKID